MSDPESEFESGSDMEGGAGRRKKKRRRGRRAAPSKRRRASSRRKKKQAGVFRQRQYDQRFLALQAREREFAEKRIDMLLRRKRTEHKDARQELKEDVNNDAMFIQMGLATIGMAPLGLAAAALMRAGKLGLADVYKHLEKGWDALGAYIGDVLKGAAHDPTPHGPTPDMEPTQQPTQQPSEERYAEIQAARLKAEADAKKAQGEAATAKLAQVKAYATREDIDAARTELKKLQEQVQFAQQAKQIADAEKAASDAALVGAQKDASEDVTRRSAELASWSGEELERRKKLERDKHANALTDLAEEHRVEIRRLRAERAEITQRMTDSNMGLSQEWLNLRQANANRQQQLAAIYRERRARLEKEHEKSMVTLDAARDEAFKKWEAAVAAKKSIDDDAVQMAAFIQEKVKELEIMRELAGAYNISLSAFEESLRKYNLTTANLSQEEIERRLKNARAPPPPPPTEEPTEPPAQEPTHEPTQAPTQEPTPQPPPTGNPGAAGSPSSGPPTAGPTIGGTDPDDPNMDVDGIPKFETPSGSGDTPPTQPVQQPTPADVSNGGTSVGAPPAPPAKTPVPPPADPSKPPVPPEKTPVPPPPLGKPTWEQAHAATVARGTPLFHAYMSAAPGSHQRNEALRLWVQFQDANPGAAREIQDPPTQPVGGNIHAHDTNTTSPTNNLHGSGKGDQPHEMDEDEIRAGMSPFRGSGFRGVVAEDEVGKLKKFAKGGTQRVSFVMNTDKRAQGGRHWVAVDWLGDKFHYYDPFGDPPTDDMKKRFSQLVRTRQTGPAQVQLKINRVPNQRENSVTCGLHSMRFLQDMHKGRSFSEATEFNTQEGEAKARELMGGPAPAFGTL